jgi:hypothetical protein
MINRHYVTEGLYSTFSQKITLSSLDDYPVFLHEVYHHIQNNSTIVGAERLNLIIQFLGQLSILSKNSTQFQFPLSAVYENKTVFNSLSSIEQKAIENIILYLDEWLYLEKFNYEPIRVSNEYNIGDIHQIDDPRRESFTPYLVMADGNRKRGYPIGGFTVSESGAYALQLLHTPNIGESVLENINDQNYQYLVILFQFQQILKNLKLSCLATFLFCDLSMIIATPAIGFYALYQTLHLTLKEGMTETDLLNWYKWQLYVWRDEIKNSLKEEHAMIKEIKKSKQKLHLNKDIDNLINQLVNLTVKGLKIRTKEPFEYVSRLIAGKETDIAYLLSEYPISVIEDLSSADVQYRGEDGLLLYALMEVISDLLPGLVMDFKHIINNPNIVHLKKIEENKYIFDLSSDIQNNDSDAYGFLFHLLGLNNKEINFVA